MGCFKCRARKVNGCFRLDTSQFHQINKLRTKKHNVEQARKAVHVVFEQIRNINFPIDLQLYLFGNVILPIALFGCGI